MIPSSTPTPLVRILLFFGGILWIPAGFGLVLSSLRGGYMPTVGIGVFIFLGGLVVWLEWWLLRTRALGRARTLQRTGALLAIAAAIALWLALIILVTSPDADFPVLSLLPATVSAALFAARIRVGIAERVERRRTRQKIEPWTHWYSRYHRSTRR